MQGECTHRIVLDFGVWRERDFPDRVTIPVRFLEGGFVVCYCSRCVSGICLKLRADGLEEYKALATLFALFQERGDVSQFKVAQAHDTNA